MIYGSFATRLRNQLHRSLVPGAIVLFVLLSAGVTSVKGQEPKSLSLEDKAKIKELCESYTSAWKANNRTAVLDLFAENAVLLPHHGHPPIVGRAAIVKFWWPEEGPPTAVTGFTQTMDEISGSGNIGYVWGSFSLSFSYEEKGQKNSVSNAGTYLMIVRRVSYGRWLITHRMWDDPVPQVQ